MSAAPRPVPRRRLFFAGCVLVLLTAAAVFTRVLLATPPLPPSSDVAAPAVPEPAPPDKLKAITPTVASDGRFTIRLLGAARGP